MNDNVLIAAMQAVFNEAVQTAVATHITQLQQQHANVVGELATKVAALETKLAEAQLFTRTTDVEVTLDKARVIEALDSQEWFWDKIQNFVQVENLTDDQLAKIAKHLDPDNLVALVDWSEVLDYAEIAGEIDLDDLASEFDAQGIADKVDVEEAVRDFFQNNTFSIRP